MVFSGITKLIENLVEQTTAADSDYMVIGGTDAKKIKWSTILGLIRDKLGIGTATLITSKKTVKEAINELNTNMKKTEYHVGDTINLYFMSAGYITGNSTTAYVTVPLAKPIGTDVKNMSVTLEKVEIRQGGSYLVNGTPTGITASFGRSTVDFARLALTKSSGFGGTNNDAVGIFVSGKIKLS